MARKITNKLLSMIEDGILDPMDLVTACLKYMPESEVAEMAAINDFIAEDEEEDQDDLVDLYEKGVMPDEDEDEDDEDDEDEE